MKSAELLYKAQAYKKLGLEYFKIYTEFTGQ